MTHGEIALCIQNCTYRQGWFFEVDITGPLVTFQLACNEDRSIQDPRDSSVFTPWKTGKKHISPQSCRQEVVALVFESIVSAEMHEVREWFRFRGASIFNPHIDPAALAELAKKRVNFNVRDNAMSMDGE